MGILGIAILKRFYPRIPAILTVVVISTAISFLIGYESMGGAIVSSINIEGLFSFKIPSFDFNAMAYSIYLCYHYLFNRFYGSNHRC